MTVGNDIRSMEKYLAGVAYAELAKKSFWLSGGLGGQALMHKDSDAW